MQLFIHAWEICLCCQQDLVHPKHHLVHWILEVLVVLAIHIHREILVVQENYFALNGNNYKCLDRHGLIYRKIEIYISSSQNNDAI